MSVSLWRILISGTDVQGVTLRENIYNVANDKNLAIKGFVRNLKHDNKVEIFCLADDDKLKKFVEEINKLNKKPVEMDSLTSTKLGNEQLARDMFSEKAFESFEIERADDLRAMVWALQGAGKIFSWMAKRGLESKLCGLRDELLYIHNYAISFEPSIDKKEFETTAIRDFLTNPLPEYKHLLKQVRDLSFTCQEANKLISSERIDTSMIEKRRNEIREMASKILGQLKEG